MKRYCVVTSATINHQMVARIVLNSTTNQCRQEFHSEHSLLNMRSQQLFLLLLYLGGMSSICESERKGALHLWVSVRWRGSMCGVLNNCIYYLNVTVWQKTILYIEGNWLSTVNWLSTDTWIDIKISFKNQNKTSWYQLIIYRTTGQTAKKSLTQRKSQTTANSKIVDLSRIENLDGIFRTL